MDIQNKEVYLRAVKKWGETLQMAMLAEEASELSAAVLQMIRGRDSLVEQEIADVIIMIEQMYVMFDGLEKKVEFAKEEKIMRLVNRINEVDPSFNYRRYLNNLLRSIKYRCSNPKKIYHKRGIKCLITTEEILSLWNRDKGWMLKKPSIDRIDNDGDYTKDNCRFIDLIRNIKRSENSGSWKSHPIAQYNMDGKLLQKYKGVMEAERMTGIGASRISAVCLNRKGCYSAGGFIWKRI